MEKINFDIFSTKQHFCDTNMNPTSIKTDSNSRQRGFVLITAVIFLLVLSLLALYGVRQSLFEEIASGNDSDEYLAREAAEQALRDAELDILGQRIDGQYCASVNKSTCGNNRRPADSRPLDAADAGNFWISTNTFVFTTSNGSVSSAARPASVDGSNVGFYSSQAIANCGRPLWQAADWDTDTPPAANRCTDANSIVRTTIYGTFTGAPTNIYTDAGRRPPRYLVEFFEASTLGISDSTKIFFRITAVGFGRIRGENGFPTSVTLQSVYSPI